MTLQALMTCNFAQAKSRPHTPTSSDGWDFESQSDGDAAAVRHRWHYNRGTVVGFVVFVLVISAFAIPESAPPLTAMASMVYQFGRRLHSQAQHHTYTAIAHLRGTPQQCVARPEPLFEAAISALRVEIRGVCCICLDLPMAIGSIFDCSDTEVLKHACAAGTNGTLPLEQPHEGSPWLVNIPQTELLTIMTPVFPDAHTLSFLKNQACSWPVCCRYNFENCQNCTAAVQHLPSPVF